MIQRHGDIEVARAGGPAAGSGTVEKRELQARFGVQEGREEFDVADGPFHEGKVTMDPSHLKAWNTRIAYCPAANGFRRGERPHRAPAPELRRVRAGQREA